MAIILAKSKISYILKVIYITPTGNRHPDIKEINKVNSF